MLPRVLLITAQFPPLNATGARRPYFLAKYLRDQGHAVTVLTDRMQAATHWEVDPAGIRVLHFDRSAHSRDVSWWQRLAEQAVGLFEGSAMHRPVRAVAEPLLPLYHGRRWACTEPAIMEMAGPQDLIVATGPGWYPFHLAHRLARRSGIPFFTDHRDPWTIAIPGVALRCINWYGSGLRGWVRRTRNHHAERKILRDAAGITAASPAYLQNALKLAGHERGAVVFNGWAPLAGQVHARNPRFTMLYAGRMYEEQDWKLVMNALDAMPRSSAGGPADLVLQVMGAGDSVPAELRAYAERSGLVEFLPEVERSTALRMAAQADQLLGVVCEGNTGQVPLKLMDYLAAGRPILLTGRTQGIQHAILERTRAGVGLAGSTALTEHLLSALRNWQAGGRPPYTPDQGALSEFSLDRQMEHWHAFLMKHAAKAHR